MDGIIRFTGCGYDTMRSEDDYKLNNPHYISKPVKFRKLIYKDDAGEEKEIKPRELSKIYWDWEKQVGEDNPKTFYKKYVYNISYDDFLDIIY